MSGMRGGLMVFKFLRKMLTRILALSKLNSWAAADDDYDDASSPSEDLPDDVKEGHFVVHIVDHGELKRFIVELGYLAHPGFLKLLDQAEEEYGFRQLDKRDFLPFLVDLMSFRGSLSTEKRKGDDGGSTLGSAISEIEGLRSDIH